MRDSQDMVSIYAAANFTEAHLLKNLLEEENIESFVSEENEPLAGLPIVPPDVYVRGTDEMRARAIVAAFQEQQMALAHRADWKCAACGATVVGAFDLCDACGADRPGSEM